MSITKQDVSLALAKTGIRSWLFCNSWPIVKPVLYELVGNTNFILRYFLRTFLNSVDAWAKDYCE